MDSVNAPLSDLHNTPVDVTDGAVKAVLRGVFKKKLFDTLKKCCSKKEVDCICFFNFY
jgi:predicted lipid carrier protein YhbT